VLGSVNVRKALEGKANAVATTGKDDIAHQRGEEWSVLLAKGPLKRENTNFWEKEIINILDEIVDLVESELQLGVCIRRW
jgi:hypothetical protein